MSLNRLNVTCACDVCKIKKTKCDRAANTKCTECIKRNIECTFYKGMGERRGPKPKKNPINDSPTIPVDPPKGICHENEIFNSLSIEEIRNFNNADVIPLDPPREIYDLNEIIYGLPTEEYFSNANQVVPIDNERTKDTRIFHPTTLPVQEYCESSVP
ncbi:5844_t:CDS:2 [Dentiscutata erythropus]|uniref:5844_t:CDS:1 n=1 Tax=Dentiscutata erythropus TaxID=1348616 RepID=A0A9N9GQV6_9GLOM|nr:5844_t:CDS:2 [Dentiscutata erythropus]